VCGMAVMVQKALGAEEEQKEVEEEQDSGGRFNGRRGRETESARRGGKHAVTAGTGDKKKACGQSPGLSLRTRLFL